MSKRIYPSIIAIMAAASLPGVLCSQASAQIVRDGTAGGAAGALTGPSYTIDAADGLASGSNLFHSFSDFQIATSESATFTDTTAGGFARVISRVTGPNASLIDGTLLVDGGTLPGADFFFINPNGVTISENATIDVPASFYLSTADQLNFDNGDALNADGSAGSTFSTASPESFGFLGPGAGAITVDAANINPTFGQNNIGLIGGSVLITDTTVGGSMARLETNDGDIGIIAVNSAQDVPLSFDVSGLDPAGLGDVSFTTSGDMIAISNPKNIGGAPANVVIAGGTVSVFGASIEQPNMSSAKDGSAVRVLAQDYTQGGGAFITVDTSAAGGAGDIIFDVRGDMILGDANSSPISGSINTFSRPGADGNAGEILFSVGGAFLMQGRFSIQNAGEALANGDGGSISIDAATLTIRNADMSTNGLGGSNSGDITINADSFTLENTAAMPFVTGMSTLSDGMGDAGAITITADTITLSGPAQIASNTQTFGVVPVPATLTGAGGDITFIADDVSLTGGASVLSSTESNGPAGDFNITANNLTLDSGFLGASTLNGSGAGGNLNIVLNNSGVLQMTNGSVISISTAGSGRAGNANITADTIRIDGGANIQAFTTSTGRAGDVSISTRIIEVLDGSFIIANAFGSLAGDAGDIDIVATEEITVAGVGASPFSSLGLNSAIASANTSPSGGASGSVSLTAPRATLADAAGLFVLSLLGNGGTITLDISDLLSITGASAISSQSVASGGATGGGGNVFINAPGVLLLSDAAIIASALDGNGGVISINAGDVIAEYGFIDVFAEGQTVEQDPLISFINATSQTGQPGTVTLGGFEGDVTAGIEELDEGFLDASEVLDRRCAGVRSAGAPSTLTQEGTIIRGKRPGDIAPAFYGEGEVEQSGDAGLLSRTATKEEGCSLTAGM